VVAYVKGLSCPGLGASFDPDMPQRLRFVVKATNVAGLSTETPPIVIIVDPD
jgi:hypothetical protein